MLNLAGSLLNKTTNQSCNFCNWKWIICSAHRHWCNKLHRKMEGHNSSWRARLYFELFCKLSKQIPAGYQAEWVSNKITRVQNIVGARLLQLSGRFHTAIAALHSNGTQAVTKEACTSFSTMLLCTPTPAFHYHICNMILAVHTDASCLSKIGGKSRAAGHF